MKENLVLIRSPIVGTFTRTGYHPDASEKWLVNIGDRVKPETIVCAVSAMMVDVEVKAKVSGTIKSILLEHEAAVDYRQPIFIVALDD